MACKNLSLLVWFGDFTARHDSTGYPNIRMRYDPLLSSITQYILYITHYLYIHYLYIKTWNGITNRETKWNTRKGHPKTEQMVLDIEEKALLYEMYPPAI